MRRAPFCHAVAFALGLSPFSVPGAFAAPPEWVRLHAEAIEIVRRPGAGRDPSALAEAATLLERALTQQDDPTLVWDLGNVEKLRGRYGRALTLFERLVSTWPTYEKANKARSHLTELRAALDATPELRVETVPSGADVEVRGVDGPVATATSPLRDLYLTPGRYTLEVRAAGHLPVREALVVRAGEPMTRRFPLVPEADAAQVDVRVAPPRLRVELDGETVGHSPLVLTAKVAPGPHELRTYAEDGTFDGRRVELAAGERGALIIEAPALPPVDRTLPYAALGVGAAAAVTGGVLVLLAADASSEADAKAAAADRAFAAGDVETGNDRGRAAASQSRDAASLGNTGLVVGGLGLAVVGAAVAWLFIDAPGASPAEDVRFTPAAGGAGFAGRF